MSSIHSNAVCSVLLDKDNQIDFPEKYSLRGTVQWEQRDTSFKAQNIPQAHAEGAKVQGQRGQPPIPAALSLRTGRGCLGCCLQWGCLAAASW